jgi:hypothetical protein
VLAQVQSYAHNVGFVVEEMIMAGRIFLNISVSRAILVPTNGSPFIILSSDRITDIVIKY